MRGTEPQTAEDDSAVVKLNAIPPDHAVPQVPRQSMHVSQSDNDSWQRWRTPFYRRSRRQRPSVAEHAAYIVLISTAGIENQQIKDNERCPSDHRQTVLFRF